MEMVRLVKKMGPRFEYHYIVASDDELSINKIPIKGHLHPIIRPTYPNSSLPHRLASTLASFAQSVILVARIQPRAALGNGPGLALAPLIATRLMGGITVYIECMARTKTISLTGRLVRPFTHAFFVQWESLKRRYPETRFAGRIA